MIAEQFAEPPPPASGLAQGDEMKSSDIYSRNMKNR